MESNQNGKAMSGLTRILLFLLVVFVASVFFYWHTLLDTPRLYTASVKLAPRLSTISALQTDAQATAAEVGIVVMSSRVWEAASQSLQDLSISLYPEAVLQTAKVYPVPGSGVALVQVTASRPELAEAAADALASETRRVYFALMNLPRVREGDKSASTLDLVAEARVAPKPIQALARTARFSAGLAAAFLIVHLGFGVGRSARKRTERQGRGRGPWWAKGGSILLFAVMAASTLVCVRAWLAPKSYYGRVYLLERLSAASTRADAEGRLTRLRKLALTRDVARRASRSLTLFYINKNPDDLLRSAKIERILGTRILAVDVFSSDFDEATIAADVLAREIQKTYSRMMNHPSSGQHTNGPSLVAMEEARMHPVGEEDRSKRMRFGLVVGAACLAFLFSAVVGSIWEQRRTRLVSGDDNPVVPGTPFPDMGPPG